MINPNKIIKDAEQYVASGKDCKESGAYESTVRIEPGRAMSFTRLERMAEMEKSGERPIPKEPISFVKVGIERALEEE